MGEGCAGGCAGEQGCKWAPKHWQKGKRPPPFPFLSSVSPAHHGTCFCPCELHVPRLARVRAMTRHGRHEKPDLHLPCHAVLRCAAPADLHAPRHAAAAAHALLGL